MKWYVVYVDNNFWPSIAPEAIFMGPFRKDKAEREAEKKRRQCYLAVSVFDASAHLS